VVVSETTSNHRVPGAEKWIVEAASPSSIGVVFRGERQNDLARRRGLGRNRVSCRGHPVSDADALVPGLRTLQGAADDHIVHVVTSVTEGPKVATDPVFKACDVHCLQVHSAPPARIAASLAGRWSRRTN